ncbi:GcrA family cell cycle regulator [Bradyrhizobium barranii]|uniref:GcrA family cell cycle regulator n=1 Tax=Bradyrhizobium barranii subsp. barranii TaxID=2823807 RepID=A0A939MFQ8_9BRAD|nr:GcrA family cell cycle regulator [Bradyrhizobium barranii]UEM11926.1 GcrA family cell cycle regulator [Bradyrhizobium barranii subsp. barranii]
MRVSVWDDPNSEQVLRTMWTQGASAALIADALQTSRNSVIGKVHRLGLSRTQRKPKLAKQPTRSNVVPMRRKTARPIKRPGEPVPFLKAKWFHCRAVLDQRGKDGLVLFCGETKVFGSPWCAKHRRAYTASRVPS